MIIPYSPRNGVLVILTGVVISAPFFTLAWILYRRTKTSISEDIVIDGVCRSTQTQGQYIYWCAPLHVKIDSLGSDLEDVKAFVTFVRMNRTSQTAWLNPEGILDSPYVTLGKGSEHEIALAIESHGVLSLYSQPAGEQSRGDDDILLVLKSRGAIVGRWSFQKAIMAGQMQQVKPVRLPTCDTGDSQI